MTIVVKFKLYNISVKKEVVKMTVLSYIKAQGERIRERHEGDTCVMFKGESAPVCRSAIEILAELNAMEGLNNKEMAFMDVSRDCFAGRECVF